MAFKGTYILHNAEFQGLVAPRKEHQNNFVFIITFIKIYLFMSLCSLDFLLSDFSSAHCSKVSNRTFLSGKLPVFIVTAPNFQNMSAIPLSLMGYLGIGAICLKINISVTSAAAERRISLSPMTFTWFLSQPKPVKAWQPNCQQLSLQDFLVGVRPVCIEIHVIILVHCLLRIQDPFLSCFTNISVLLTFLTNLKKIYNKTDPLPYRKS